MKGLSRQQVFNRVVKHCRRQKVQASSGRHCLYLESVTGRRCAIGCLLPKGEWLFSRIGVQPLLVTYPELRELFSFLDEDGASDFLVDLQELHDRYLPGEVNKSMEFFENRVRILAKRYNLRIPKEEK